MEALQGRARSRDAPADSLSPEDIDGFLEHLAEKGRGKETIAKYRRDLYRLYGFLSPGGSLESGLLERWREAQLEEGYGPGTVNTCISAANSLFDYLGRRDLQIAPMRLSGGGGQPELTRAEYLRLLQTARLLKKERLYLLVKVFGSVGIQVHELEQLTVKAAEAGQVSALRIPDCLRAELLDYAGREHIHSGPIFLTRTGRPLRRTSVTGSISRLCREAQVDEVKGNPRCLRRLCLSTMGSIQLHFRLLAQQSYDHLLLSEQSAVAWGDDAIK